MHQNVLKKLFLFFWIYIYIYIYIYTYVCICMYMYIYIHRNYKNIVRYIYRRSSSKVSEKPKKQKLIFLCDIKRWYIKVDQYILYIGFSWLKVGIREGNLLTYSLSLSLSPYIYIYQYAQHSKGDSRNWRQQAFLTLVSTESSAPRLSYFIRFFFL